jgi:hypothetical protein
MSDDGPQNDFIVATTFQGPSPNGASCLLEMLVMGLFFAMLLPHFSGLRHVLETYIKYVVIVYLDDICICSNSFEQRIDHLRLMLQ